MYCYSLQSAYLSTAAEPQVGKTSPTSNEDEEIIAKVFSLLSDVFLPAFTRIECNPGVSTEIWAVVSLFPFQIRFELYDAWKGIGFGKDAVGLKDNRIGLAEVLCQEGSKYHMKRLAKVFSCIDITVILVLVLLIECVIQNSMLYVNKYEIICNILGQFQKHRPFHSKICPQLSNPGVQSYFVSDSVWLRQSNSSGC